MHPNCVWRIVNDLETGKNHVVYNVGGHLIDVLSFSARDGTDFVDEDNVETVFVVPEFAGETFLRLQVIFHCTWFRYPVPVPVLNQAVLEQCMALLRSLDVLSRIRTYFHS
jgi:hypothetical protein